MYTVYAYVYILMHIYIYMYVQGWPQKKSKMQFENWEHSTQNAIALFNYLKHIVTNS
jgi:hypothetical protein